MQRAGDSLAAPPPGSGGMPSMSGAPAEGGLLPPPATDGERFFEDLKVFVADTGALLQQARSLSGEGALAAREEFERRLVRAREGLYTARSQAMDRMVDWRDRTERYVRDEPWTAVGIAAAAGFVIGMLSRRGDR